MIGVLGGMGPLATADFFSKVIAATSAQVDSDHVPLLIQSDPRIPPRPAAILANGESPLPALLAGRDRLIAGGAIALAMPCNTAHFWHPQLAADCPVPFLSIVDAACGELGGRAAAGGKIGILGTRATLAAKLFDAQLARLGVAPVTPSDAQMQELVLPAIEMVKAGRVLEAAKPLDNAIQALMAQGASRVILACTEVPIALDAAQSNLRDVCIDATAALARSCVSWWMTTGKFHKG